ncbi:MAG: hypothetical protein ACI9N1_000286 [Flavobacteriales bacterium]|jgi:hypothetical protein
MDELIDDITGDINYKFSIKKINIVLILICVSLCIFNLIVAPYGLSKFPIFGPEGQDRILGIFTIGVGMWGFVLGLLISLIPFRSLPYKKKYITASLLGMCIVQLLMTLSVTMIALR